MTEDAGVPLNVLLSYVDRGIKGDRKLFVALYRQMQRLAHHPEAPADERRLGELLCQVMIGERHPDLAGLPEDVAGEVKAWLDGL
jgi:hypothetical protein